MAPCRYRIWRPKSFPMTSLASLASVMMSCTGPLLLVTNQLHTPMSRYCHHKKFYVFSDEPHTHKRQLFTQKLGAFSQNCCNASSWFSSARPNLSAFHRSTLCPLLAALAGLLNTFLQFCWHFGLCFGSSFGNCLGLRLVVSGRSKCCFRWFWLLFGVPVKSLGAVWGAVFVPLSGPALGLVFDVVLFAACRHPSGSFCNYLTLLLEFLDAVFSAALRRYLRRDFLHKQHPPLHL